MQHNLHSDIIISSANPDVQCLHPSLHTCCFLSNNRLPSGMQAKDPELRQQLDAAGDLETDLRAQLNVSLLLLFASA